jgi:2-pyrone-4,6-dicarboxylate lactonase
MSTVAENFEKTAGWLDWHPNPSKPNFRPPPGAVDAHCHVFGPSTEFPFAPERKYTPCDASKHQLYALRDHLGFSRNVLVQATCHGADNRATVDAVMSSGGKAKGIATVKPSVSDEELEYLNSNSIKGVRFNFVKRLVDPLPPAVLAKLVDRINKYGWHIVIYFEALELPELYDFISDISTTVVVDHMGRPDVTKDVDGPEFALFQKLIEENKHIWSKVTCPERLSKSGPPKYDDFVPFAARLVERFPDRVLWGTDWPHPNLTDHIPDDAWLVDMIPRIAPTGALQQRLLVDNPMRLYWPEETTQ